MFGYVRPLLSRLTGGEKELYNAAYCGLCHTMGRRYGFLSRFTLNYDFTFLAILLAGDQSVPEICRRKCPAHPLRRKKGCVEMSGLDTAADESMILTWHKLCDDVVDKGFWAGLPARAACLLFRGAYRRAADRCPVFDRRVREQLGRLRDLEQARSPSIDRTADAFALILEAAAPESGDEARDRVLGQLLYHVGRWIYLADAWDDLADDRAHGSYNPLDLRFEGRPEDHIEQLRTTMTHSLKLSISAYHLAGFGGWSGILENILYLGLPTVQEAVLAGKWREMQKSREKANE